VAPTGDINRKSRNVSNRFRPKVEAASFIYVAALLKTITDARCIRQRGALDRAGCDAGGGPSGSDLYLKANGCTDSVTNGFRPGSMAGSKNHLSRDA
jgi:hypothetical protein